MTIALEPAQQQLAHDNTQGVHDAITAQERLRHSWSKVQSPTRAAAVEVIRQAVSLKIIDRTQAHYGYAVVESSNTQEPRNGIFRGRISNAEIAAVMMVSERTVIRIRNGCRITGRRALADNRPNTVGIVRLDDESAQGGKLRCGRGIVPLHYFNIAELERLVNAAKAPTMDLPIKGDTLSHKEITHWDYDSQYAALPAAEQQLAAHAQLAAEDRAARCIDYGTPQSQDRIDRHVKSELDLARWRTHAQTYRSIAPTPRQRAERDEIPRSVGAAISSSALDSASGITNTDTPRHTPSPTSLVQGAESWEPSWMEDWMERQAFHESCGDSFLSDYTANPCRWYAPHEDVA